MRPGHYLSPTRVDLACRSLRAGGVIAYPTEAVWGLGCDPDNSQAVRRLLQLKGRSPAKGLILVADRFERFSAWLGNLPQESLRAVLESWPGHLTWVVPHRGLGSPWITGRHSGIALRVSAHPLVAALCARYGGPLVSTSANPEGRRPALSEWQLRKYFGTTLDYILCGCLGGAARPSEIRDAISGRALRVG